MQLAQLGAKTALQPPERGDHRRRHAIFLLGARERRRMHPDSRLRILCRAVGRPVSGEFGEHLAEHALAAVAVDDALVVDEVGRGLGQRALRDALRHRLLLEVGEEAVERHAVVTGRRTGRARSGGAAAAARAAGATAGLGARAAGRAGAGAGWAMARDERDRDAAAATRNLKSGINVTGSKGTRRVGKAKRAHHFASNSASSIKMVGTAQVRLCPPYGRLGAIRRASPAARIGACRINLISQAVPTASRRVGLSHCRADIRPSPIWGGQTKREMAEDHDGTPISGA